MGFGVSNGSKLTLLGMAGLVCSPGVEADENVQYKAIHIFYLHV